MDRDVIVAASADGLDTSDKRQQRQLYQDLVARIHLPTLRETETVALEDGRKLHIGADAVGNWVLWESWTELSFLGGHAEQHQRRTYLAAADSRDEILADRADRLAAIEA